MHRPMTVGEFFWYNGLGHEVVAIIDGEEGRGHKYRVKRLTDGFEFMMAPRARVVRCPRNRT